MGLSDAVVSGLIPKCSIPYIAAPFSHITASSAPSSAQKASISGFVLLEFGIIFSPDARHSKMKSLISTNEKSSWPKRVPSKSVKMSGFRIGRLLNDYIIDQACDADKFTLFAKPNTPIYCVKGHSDFVDKGEAFHPPQFILIV